VRVSSTLAVAGVFGERGERRETLAVGGEDFGAGGAVEEVEAVDERGGVFGEAGGSAGLGRK